MESTECEGGDEGDLVNRSTKKVPIRGMEEGWDVVMDTTLVAEKVLSWKDRLVGTRLRADERTTTSDGLDGAEEFKLLEEDVECSSVNGITGNKREQRQSSKENKEELAPNPYTYRPWMLAERWGRCTVRTERKDSGETQAQLADNSRFQVLENLVGEGDSQVHVVGSKVDLGQGVLGPLVLSPRGEEGPFHISSVKANGSRKGKKLKKVMKEKGSPFKASPSKLPLVESVSNMVKLLQSQFQLRLVNEVPKVMDEKSGE
ncbi:hypothetical protein Gogos_017721 [Gossypium gossypioides]|uniref:Uncharacterized protein n=1 Tax=Gossypium gossypioides TaxID=34282 RepID=A0A7J9BBS8_GOSGO|nr:hypothetical protein [Gossypium gossypioides]